MQRSSSGVTATIHSDMTTLRKLAVSHRTLDDCRGDVATYIAQYKKLNMLCPQCERHTQFACPVQLIGQSCGHCGHPLDPMEWHDLGPVNHRLMRRLIRICYRHPRFASRVIQHYRRDPDRSVAPEWGIDKGLLLVHAANAVAQHGHRSLWVFAACLLGAVPPLAIVPLLLMRWRVRLNADAERRFEPTKPYDPTAIDPASFPVLARILHFANGAYPRNVFFFNGFHVLETLGQDDGAWSFLVDRRKLTGGMVSDQPAAFDVEYVLNRIAARTIQQGGPDHYPGRYSVRDVILVRGPGLAIHDRRFLDEASRPRYEIASDVLEQERGKHDERSRVYTHIATYDAKRDLSIASFVRLEHRGAFTYIESLGTRLLPVADRLFGTYSAEPTAAERQRFRKLPWLLRSMSEVTRKRVARALLLYPIVLLASTPILAGNLALGMVAPVILLVLLAAINYGTPLHLYDKFERRARPFPLKLLLGFFEEKARTKQLGFIADVKAAAEFDYGPKLYSIRSWQARGAESQIDLSDLRVLRRSQELTIQDTFIECLEESGIDTSDFREAAAQINNYGIINSGNIGGDAKTNQEQAPHSTGKHRVARGRADRGAPAAVRKTS